MTGHVGVGLSDKLSDPIKHLPRQSPRVGSRIDQLNARVSALCFLRAARALFCVV